MFILDMYTLIATLVLVSYICTIIVYATSLTLYKKYRGMKYFLISYSVLTIGITMVVFVDVLPAIFGVVIPNILMYASIVYFLVGIVEVNELPQNTSLYKYIMIIFTLIYYYFTIIDTNVSMRIITFSMFALATYTHMTFIALNQLKEKSKAATKSMFVVVMLTAIVYGIRLMVALKGTYIADYFVSKHSDAFSVLSLSATIILLTFALSMMFQRRLMVEIEIGNSERNQLMEKLKEQAFIDELTQIYNRRKLEELLTYQIALNKRYNNVFSIILIDIDHFKRVNDTYGHNIGDIVLFKFSQMIKSKLRVVDIVGRWGGEEFIILLPEIGINQAVDIAEKIRFEVSNMTIDELSSDDGITISLGVLEYDGEKKTDDFIGEVDCLLYMAKENGRNQVKF